MSDDLARELAALAQRVKSIEAKQEKHASKMWVPFGASAGIFVTLFLLVLAQQAGILDRLSAVSSSIAVIESNLVNQNRMQQLQLEALEQRLGK